ncbi:isoleucine--tRNA ligase [Mycoplasma phocimorsus]|uniref:isoleucine--tRNA ligase n=1 Tax=Mycoplasma phocimorsus TaxID=3045839 RepID=UPI0024C060AE|nr:isoleucine--tRNA ligase [Mycoplasma phocimorsus]MDJ1648101.1 isoleucine--tRNA ligase [Mycoplasma phocimorsus]
MDYKKTLNMPFTKFDMRGNLTIKEPLFRKKWEEMNLYQLILDSNDKDKQFILHDGPPYANGDIHVGHALNKILKDIVVRYKTMSGFYSPFVAGWDTHGLPIEHKMLSETKINKEEISKVILRKKAAKYALKQVERQKKQFDLLQLQSPLNDKYLTLNPLFEAKQLRLFQKMWNDGLIYKGLKPVYWSPTSQSALAEAEVEYKNHISPSIFVAFEISKGNNIVKKGDKLIIWTTTPWTLFANAGIALGEKFEYSLVKYEGTNYILASKLASDLIEQFNWKGAKTVANFKASELLNVEYISIFNLNPSPVIIGHHVTLESGTGLVHIAPLFGEDDFLIGKKQNLNMIMHILDNGNISSSWSKYENIFYLEADKLIIDELKSLNALIQYKELEHSYPHDWRTHKPVMYRGTPQWFVSIDKIKDNIINALEDVKFYTPWAKKRLSKMIENRNDWTISRQRAWGVPIICFYDENNEIVLNDEIFDHVINIIEQKGTDAWYEMSNDELLPVAYRNLNLKKEEDIMDVWFDSGSSFLGVNIPNSKLPFDLYLEGSDQFRGWFNSSLINSVAYSNKAPYKNLVSHGFVLDAKNQKMSKSLGNTVDPLEVVKKYGADILRLWVANSEYTNDINISDDILKQNGEVYKSIRNKIKFMLSNLNNFEFNENQQLSGIHKYINNELSKLQQNIFTAYDNFQFLIVIKEINNYLTNLSSFYLSIAKDILYVLDENDEQVKMTKHNLFLISRFIIKALAPILPTTAEDAYEHFNSKNKKLSVHLEKFDAYVKFDAEIEKNWKEFFNLREQVNFMLEEAIKNKQINRSAEAIVTIKSNPVNEICLKQLAKLLLVAKVEIADKMSVKNAYYFKCERCWNFFEEIYIKNEVCESCFSILESKDFYGSN